MVTINARPFQKAYIMACCWLLVLLVVIFLALGAPQSAEGFGEVAGRLLVTFALSGGISGFVVRRSKRIWPMWQIALLVLFIGVGLSIVAALGAAGAHS